MHGITLGWYTTGPDQKENKISGNYLKLEYVSKNWMNDTQDPTPASIATGLPR